MTFPSAFLLCLFTLLPTSSVSTTLLSSLLSTASPIQTRSILGAKAILTDSDQIQTFVQQLASSRRPVVITGLDPTLLDVDKLNPTTENPLYDFNVNNVRVLTLQSDPTLHTYAIQSPLTTPNVVRSSGVLDESPNVAVFVPDETNVRNDVSMKQFLDADADATELLYWTGDLRDTTPALVSALGIWSSLMIKDDLGTATDDSIHIPMLWCSSPTVAAQTHHDKSHNVFVQVSGTKDILLLPPSAVKLISAYPSVHAGKKMSQMPFEEEYDKVVARFPNVTQLVDSKTAQKVTLKAGEALYIPPYWYHSITSNDEVAVSLSVVSPSWEEALVGRVGYTPLPIGGVEGRVERMMAVQSILIQIISRLPMLGSPAIFSDWIWGSRWKNLEGGEGEGGECFSEVEIEEVMRVSGKWEADEELGYRFSESAKEVALAIEDDMLLNGIKMAFMADYVEQLAGWAVGVEESGRFVRDCLGYDNVEVMEEWDGLEALLEGGQGDPNRVRKGEELSQEL